MEPNYQLIDEKVNSYAMDVISEILAKYSGIISKEAEEILWRRLNEKKIIIVDKPSVEDDLFFDNDIPTAHGPRTKNDGLIHIYPYKFPNLSNDELIQRYIDHIITHEIYHYLIKLDINNTYTPDEVAFGHYITEGMVQLMTEKHTDILDTTSKYRKNVDSASIILDKCLENNDLSIIFRQNYKQIFEKYPNLASVYESYLKEKELEEKLTPLLTEIANKTSWEPKRLVSKLKMSSMNVLKENMISFIQNKLPNESENYEKQIDEIYASIYDQNKKSI